MCNSKTCSTVEPLLLISIKRLTGWFYFLRLLIISAHEPIISMGVHIRGTLKKKEGKMDSLASGITQVYRELQGLQGKINPTLEAGFLTYVKENFPTREDLRNLCGYMPTGTMLCLDAHGELILASKTPAEIVDSLFFYNQACGWPLPKYLDEYARGILETVSSRKRIELCANENWLTKPIKRYIKNL